MSTKCCIVVDEGNDTSAYHTDAAPTYEAVWIPVENGEPSRVIFCVFTPKNGINRNNLVRVTFSRIISVAELSP